MVSGRPSDFPVFFERPKTVRFDPPSRISVGRANRIPVAVACEIVTRAYNFEALQSAVFARTVPRFRKTAADTVGRAAMHAMLAAWTVLGVAASSDPWPSAAASTNNAEETADSYTTAYLNVTSYDLTTGLMVQSDKSEIGKFGEYHVGVASGVLLHVVGTDGDRNGCAPPVRGVQKLPVVGPWIALVRRGKCSFQNKVDNARRAGASAVIVYNDRESTDLDKMKLLPSDPSES